MKQISYLTMIFLPASFVAVRNRYHDSRVDKQAHILLHQSLFGMNIHNLEDGTHGTWGHYFEIAIPLTALTIWIVVSLRSNRVSRAEADGLLYRLQWPIRSVRWLMERNGKTEANAFEGVV